MLTDYEMFCAQWWLVAWAMAERAVTARHDPTWETRVRIVERMRLAA